MAHPNVTLLEKMDEATGRGDVEGFLATLTDDVVVHVGGRSKLAGDFKGKEEVVKAFGMLIQAVGEDMTFERHAILADDEHGVALQTLISKKKGSPGPIPGVGIFHFRDGLISEAWFADMDPYTADPFYDA